MTFNYETANNNDDRLTDRSKPQIWSVGALCSAVADALQARFNPVSVQGEISGFVQASSGHLYFSLKDATGQLRCAMFRRAASTINGTLRNGDKVIVKGRVTVYEPRGDLQLVVETLQRAGQGDLYEQFIRLKNELQKEGLFDSERKRSLIEMPRGIALITSPDGAALHDVLTTLKRRAAHVPVLFLPALVQGAQAPDSLQKALQRLYEGIWEGSFRQADGRAFNIDAILMVRGGGSIEDLWAFNDANLARLIVQSPVPLISGIGHETDFTIADFCADVRAPTPTAAAELVSMSQEQALQWCQRMQERLDQALDQTLGRYSEQLQQLQQKLMRPSMLLARHEARLDRLEQGLRYSLSAQLHQRQFQLKSMQERLDQALNQTLGRYSGQLQQLQQKLMRPSMLLARHEARLGRLEQGLRHSLSAQWYQRQFQLKTFQERLPRIVHMALDKQEQKLERLNLRASMLDPQKILERGYAILQTQEGEVVRDVAALHENQMLNARVANGSVKLSVQESD